MTTDAKKEPTCPTCGSDNPAVPMRDETRRHVSVCADAWHKPPATTEKAEWETLICKQHFKGCTCKSRYDTRPCVQNRSDLIAAVRLALDKGEAETWRDAEMMAVHGDVTRDDLIKKVADFAAAAEARTKGEGDGT